MPYRSGGLPIYNSGTFLKEYRVPMIDTYCLNYFMQKKICLFLTVTLILQNLDVSAQTGSSVSNLFTEERDKFLGKLKDVAVDTSITYPLSRSIRPEINSIYASIQSENALSADEKDKAVRTLIYFMKEHSRNMELQ